MTIILLSSCIVVKICIYTGTTVETRLVDTWVRYCNIQQEEIAIAFSSIFCVM